jgi:hypothetical protein
MRSLVKHFLCILFALSLISCGYAKDKLGIDDGSDGAQGPVGEAGEDASANAASKACSIDIPYTNGKEYRVVYAEVEFSDGVKLASLRHFEKDSGAVTFQESAVFEKGVTPHIESPSWCYADGVLTYKPTKKEYKLDCK